MLALRKYGSWAWALGIALIWADLVLPNPRLVIAALGIQPILALMVSYVLPILLLPIALYLMRLRTQ